MITLQQDPRTPLGLYYCHRWWCVGWNGVDHAITWKLSTGVLCWIKDWFHKSLPKNHSFSQKVWENETSQEQHKEFPYQKSPYLRLMMSIKKQHIFVQLLAKLKWFYDYRPPSINMQFLVRKYSICPRMKSQFGTASSLNSRENWFAVKSASLSYCFGLNNNDDFWQLWVDYHRESWGPSQ